MMLFVALFSICYVQIIHIKKLKNAIKIGKQCVFDKTKMMIRSNCPENPTPKWRMFWKKPKGEGSMQKP